MPIRLLKLQVFRLNKALGCYCCPFIEKTFRLFKPGKLKVTGKLMSSRLFYIADADISGKIVGYIFELAEDYS